MSGESFYASDRTTEHIQIYQDGQHGNCWEIHTSLQLLRWPSVCILCTYNAASTHKSRLKVVKKNLWIFHQITSILTKPTLTSPNDMFIFNSNVFLTIHVTLNFIFYITSIPAFSYSRCLRPNMEISMYNFMDVMRKVAADMPWQSHLRNTCRRMRIVSIWKDPPADAANGHRALQTPTDFNDTDIESDEDLPAFNMDLS